MAHCHVVTTIDNSIEAIRTYLPMKGEYTMIDLTQKLTGVIRTIKASIRADNSMTKVEAVVVYLDIDYSDCSIEDVLQFSNADRKIAAVVPLRAGFAKLTSNQHIKVKASSPGAKAPQSAMDILIASAAASGRTVTEQFEFERKARNL